jgi:hypothetical protein
MTPAASVSGSPMTGIQLSNSDHLPWRAYHVCARASAAGFTGNQRRSLKRTTCRPSHQLTTEPSTLPTLATTTSHSGS